MYHLSLRYLYTFCISLCLFCQFIRPALAQKRWIEAASTKRVALIIANTQYAGDNLLTYPVNDAVRMREALKALHFTVFVHYDRTSTEIESDIDAFAEELSSDSVAFFYYSGHGAQVAGQNYLLPIDFKKRSMETIEEDAVNVRRVLKKMEERRSPLNIIVLDACRNNPYVDAVKGDSNGTKKGLAQTKAPKGTLIAYATAPDETADDNGLYSRALASEIQKPGIGLFDVFNNVSAKISETTKQTPWMSSTVIPLFYFANGKTSPPDENTDLVSGPSSPYKDVVKIKPEISKLFEQSKKQFRDLPVDNTRPSRSDVPELLVWGVRSPLSLPGCLWGDVMVEKYKTKTYGEFIKCSIEVLIENRGTSHAEVRRRYDDLQKTLRECLPHTYRMNEEKIKVALSSCKFNTGSLHQPSISLQLRESPMTLSEFSLHIFVEVNIGGPDNWDDK